MERLLLLVDRWLDEAAFLRRHGAVEAAATTELNARQLEEAIRSAEDETLTLSEAAAASGYAKRTLREKVAKGEIPNAGRKHAPRVRRGDLPKRASLANGSDFDAQAHARRIAGKGSRS